MKQRDGLERLLLDTAWLFRQYIGRAFDGPNVIASLTGSQHLIIRGLGWGPRSMSEVADIAGISNSSATAIVDRLVARGLVTKSRDAANRRWVLVALRPQGEHLLHQLLEQGEAQARVLVEQLNEEEKIELERLLCRLKDAMQKETGEGALVSTPRRRTGSASQRLSLAARWADGSRPSIGGNG